MVALAPVMTREINARTGRVGCAGGLLMLLLVMLLAAAAIARNVHCALAALLPAVLLAAIVAGRPRSCRVLFDDTGLRTADLRSSIRYDAICGLLVNSSPCLPEKAPWRGVVRVLTPTTRIELAGRFDVSRDKVLRFLLDRIPRGGRMPHQPALRDFAEAQRVEFGAERVWTFRAAERCPGRSQLKYAAWGLACVSGIWIAASALSRGWAAAAVVPFVFALLFALLASQSNRGRVAVGANWREAGLVIAPVGLAMIQGDLNGTIRWSEIRMTTFRGGSLIIHVAGAAVTIADVYDRPIQQIAELIWAYLGIGRPGAGPRSTGSPGADGERSIADARNWPVSRPQ
jgi:hypothetical protein